MTHSLLDADELAVAAGSDGWSASWAWPIFSEGGRVGDVWRGEGRPRRSLAAARRRLPLSIVDSSSQPIGTVVRMPTALRALLYEPRHKLLGANGETLGLARRIARPRELGWGARQPWGVTDTAGRVSYEFRPSSTDDYAWELVDADDHVIGDIVCEVQVLRADTRKRCLLRGHRKLLEPARTLVVLTALVAMPWQRAYNFHRPWTDRVPSDDGKLVRDAMK